MLRQKNTFNWLKGRVGRVARESFPPSADAPSKTAQKTVQVGGIVPKQGRGKTRSATLEKYIANHKKKPRKSRRCRASRRISRLPHLSVGGEKSPCTFGGQKRGKERKRDKAESHLTRDRDRTKIIGVLLVSLKRATKSGEFKILQSRVEITAGGPTLPGSGGGEQEAHCARELGGGSSGHGRRGGERGGNNRGLLGTIARQDDGKNSMGGKLE